MHSVIINGKKYTVEDSAPLRECLTEAGFHFPCGGAGKCGKCRINCPSLPISDLDRRFLGDRQLSDGVRLACDKKVTSSLSLECELGTSHTDIVLRECSIAVNIVDEEIDIAIVGESTVETVTKPNPLKNMTVEEIVTEYEKNPSPLTNALRAVIGKESVELFEKYGSAKASTTAIGSKGLYLKILAGLPLDCAIEDVETKGETDPFGLPTESIYLLPTVDDFVGGDILTETIKLKENSILVDCEKTVTLFAIGEEDDLTTALWDCDYSDVAYRCIRAAVKFLLTEVKAPVITLCGRYADSVEDVLNEAGLTTIQIEKNIENTVQALLSFRARAKLNKEKNRTTTIKIFDNEIFQSFLTE